MIANHDYDRLSAMVIATDSSGRIEYVNEAVGSLLRYPKESLSGTFLKDLVRPASTGGHQIRTVDGDYLAVVVSETDRGHIGTLLTAIPIPVSDDALRDAKLLALGELAHHVVHELNQPLSVIRMAIGTARRKLSIPGEVDIPFVDAKLERIDSQCVRAAEIVETMRVFVPRDRQVQVLIDVNRALERALAMTAPKFRKLNTSFNVTLGTGCRVLVNEMQLEPALLCVLGVVHARIARSGLERPLEIGVRTTLLDNDLVEIRIDHQFRELVEDSDNTAPSTITLGMDLGLTRELVRELAGTFQIIHADVGTTYRLELPLAAHDG